MFAPGSRDHFCLVYQQYGDEYHQRYQYGITACGRRSRLLSAEQQDCIGQQVYNADYGCQHEKRKVNNSSTSSNHMVYSLFGGSNGGGTDPVPNAPPVASFTYTVSGLTVSFTDTSTDSDGNISSWSWAFGDGSTSTAQSPSHTYGAGDSYTVTLTVTDDDGETGTTSQSITVTTPAEPGTISLSVNGYKVQGRHHAELTWSGATSNNVDIFRDGNKITTTSNSGSYTDNIGARGGATYSYQVCEAETTSCSAVVTVTI
jgi:serine protease